MKKYRYIILILSILILIITGIIIYAKYFEENIIFTLFGEHEITLYEGEEYLENGYIAYNENGDNLNAKVKVVSNLDVNKPGDYKINYSIRTLLKKYSAERHIKVIKDNLKEIEFTLKGYKEINLKLGDTYKDETFTCINRETGEDLRRYVITESDLNTNKVGNYTIKYHLIYDGKEKVLTRKINILQETANHTLSTISLTNKPVLINFESYISNFAYVICPNEKFMYDKSFSYYVFDNGKYVFYVYDANKHYEEYVINITNIDRTAPSGSCTANLLDGKTSYAVKTSDTDIDYLLYNNEEKYKSTKYNEIINKYQRKGIVALVDNAGNKTVLDCQVNRTYLKPIAKTSAKNIVYEAKSASLEISISYQDDYYISYIWAKDPYLQLKKELVEKDLMYPKKILEQAIKKYKYNDKLIFSSAASGTVKKGSFYDELVSKNNIYNLKEPSALDVYNGKVIINDYSNYYAVGPIYYVNESNVLTYIPSLANISSKNRQKIFEDALDSGILNTFAFSPVLVINGKAEKISNDYYALRNGLCQVDENNFISVISKNKHWDRQDFANFMADLGCQTAINLDGGGSVALLYKEHGSSNIKVLSGNARTLSNIYYFVEL